MEIDKEPTPVIKGNIEQNVTILFLKAIFNLLTTGSSLVDYILLLIVSY